MLLDSEMEARYGCRIWVLNPRKGKETARKSLHRAPFPGDPCQPLTCRSLRRRLSSHTSKHTVFLDQDVCKNQYFYKFHDLSVNSTKPVHHDKRSHSKETPGGRSDEPQSTMTREGPHTATDSSTVKVIF